MWNSSTKSRFLRFHLFRGPSAISPLTLGFAYSFDLFMNSFVEQPREFPSPFCGETPSSMDSVPRFSERFHQIASWLVAGVSSSYYDRFKSFCIAIWTEFLHSTEIPAGISLLDRIDSFCESMKRSLREGFPVSPIVEIQESELFSILQQMLFNLFGGGLLRQIAAENREKERLLNSAIHIHQFLLPQHLEIPAEYVETPRFSQAVEAFRSMSFCRSPCFMLRCLAETWKLLGSLLREPGRENRGDPIGADDFVPLFIYCVLRSDSEFLHATCVFIDRFRRTNEMEMG